MPVDRKLIKTGTPGVYRRGGRYVVILRGPDGKQRKHAARTLAEARDLKARLTADVSRGEYRTQSRITFSQYAEQWLATYGGRTSRGPIRVTTEREYRRYIEQRAMPYFGRRRLTQIEPRDIKLYAAHVAADGVARNTVRNCIAALRVLLATAVEDGLLRSNPATHVRLPAIEQATESDTAKALTEAQLAALLAACPQQWRLLTGFLADTGLRIGEALALTWADVDFGRGRVEVRRRVYEGVYAPPKSKYGRRDVPISPGLGQALWAHRGAVRAAADDALIWPGKAGKPLNAATAYRGIKAACATAGVPWASPHTLRHTCATRLFNAGLNAKQVQVWLGHHSPAFTLDTYVHLLPDDLPETPFATASLHVPEPLEVAASAAQGGAIAPRQGSVGGRQLEAAPSFTATLGTLEQSEHGDETASTRELNDKRLGFGS